MKSVLQVLAGVWTWLLARTRSRGGSAHRTALPAALLAGGAAALAQQPAPNTLPNALPTGGQVVAGQAGISQQGPTLTVEQQSGRAAIDWQSFDIGAQAHVRFQQPSANSVVLNRVQGPNASQIAGRISANGQVFLSNPNGVYFAPGASVDVGGLVATTHRIGLDEFMAGTLRFDRKGATGSVVNEGELRAALGGYIALLAPEVRNQGLIVANLGTVALAAGETFELRIDGGRNLAALRVEPGTLRALVDNRSVVLAPGGLVILSAQALDRVQGGVVKNSGRIEATGMAQRGGRIVLEASDRIENTGTIDASATAHGPAGSIGLRAPEVVNDGAVVATGSAEHGTGGQVLIAAGNVTQTGAALVDVSAPVRGGSVQVQASGHAVIDGSIVAAATAPAEPQAQGGSVTVQAAQITLHAATIDASAITGGHVLLDGSGAAPAAPPAPRPAPEPGKLALTGATQVSTRGRRGSGGGITLIGDDIALVDTTALDASGATGGGTVRVGGGWQGGDGLHQATTVMLARGADIDVSARDSGRGGTAVLWSDVTKAASLTGALGRITARGVNGGGSVETSGHAVDTAGLAVDASASHGPGGLWLIDPYNYTIATAQAATIGAALNTGTSVTVTTTANNAAYGSSGNAAQAGTITVANAIAKTAGGDATLTLQAHDRIGVNAGIGSSAGKLNLVLWSNYGGGSGGISVSGAALVTNGGHVWMGGSSSAGGSSTWNGLTVGNGSATTTAATTVALELTSGTSITTAGGSVMGLGLANYTGGSAATWTNAVLVHNATIDAGSGNVALTGQISGNYDYGTAVEVRTGSAITTTSGSITLNGGASASNSPADQVLTTYVHDHVTIGSGSGAINLYGDNRANALYGTGVWLGSTATAGGGGSGDGNQSSGLGNGYDVAVVSNSGNVLADGRAASARTDGWMHGFALLSFGSDRQLLKTTSGNVTLKGDANVARNDASGVQFQVNTATGNLNVVSTSGDLYVQGFQHSGSSNAQNNALRFTPGDSDGSIRFGAASDGAASSGRVTFEADSIWNNTANTSRVGAIRAFGSGSLAFQSTGAVSVKDFVLPVLWSFGSAHGGFSIGKPTETRNITLNASVTAAGPITLQGGDIVLNGNLTTTASGAGISLLATGTLYSLTNANTLTTSGGAVVLAADRDGSDSGSIQFSQGLTIDTRVGTATSGGGAITLGGGNALGTGYAAGISAADAEGIRIDNGLTLRSGGGDINLRGRSWAGPVSNSSGAWGVGFYFDTNGTSFVADSGTGRIRIEGIGRGNNGNAYDEGIVMRAATDVRSAYAGNDAIVLVGSSAGTATFGVGIDIGADANNAAVGYNTFVASGAGGGITLQGKSQGPYSAIAMRNGSRMLTNGGALNLTGTTPGALLTLQNAGNQWWGSAAASPLTASSSNLTLQFDTYQFGGARPNIATTGRFTLVPVGDVSGNVRQVSTEWFAFNQNGQTISGLVYGKPTDTAWDIALDGSGGVGNTLVVNGPVSVWGHKVTLTAPLQVTGSGDILLQGRGNANPDVLISNTITKTGGADATLTLKGAGRVTANAGISASGAGKLNMVFWADSDGDRTGGVSVLTGATYNTNGGHLWLGGSSTPNGSTAWNGLTVGNGASAGSYASNYNGMDLQATFVTGGGDFYAAAKTYVTDAGDIVANGGSIVVNAGSGNVTFVGNRFDFRGATAGATTAVTSTGTLTLRPYDASFRDTFNIKGTVSGSDWIGSTNTADTGTANLVLRNVASLGGFVVGKDTNTTPVIVQSSLGIAGDISLYGGRIANANNASLTSSGGNILLDADLARTVNLNATGIQWTNGAINAASTTAGKGNITLLGRGGSRANADNHGVWVATGTSITAGGDLAITGLAPTDSNAGVVFAAGTSASAGRTLAIDGRNTASAAATDSYGLRLRNSSTLTAAGALALTGSAGTGTTQAIQLNNASAVSTTGSAGASAITLTALNGSIGSSDGAGTTGSNLATTIGAGAGSGITLAADRLDMIASRPLTLSTTGVLTIAPASANFGVNTFTWDGALAGGNFAGSGSLANVRVNNLAGIGGLTLGKAGNTSNIAVAAAIGAAGPIRLFGQDVALDAALVASGNATAANNRIAITAAGSVTQTAAFAAQGLALLGSGRYTLNHSGNDVATLTAGTPGTPGTPVARLAYSDANAVAVTGIDASGTVAVSTLTGNLSVSGNVSTTSTADTAVVLNAGRNKAVADVDFYSGAGGSIAFSGGAGVSVGSGGRATLYTGTVAGSGGVTALVGSGSGRFRYGSDETTTGYVTALGSGLYAVYREQPTLTLKGTDQTVTYGTDPALAVGASGLVNGDTVAQGIGRLPTATLAGNGVTAARNAQGHFDVRRDTNGTVTGYGMRLSRDAAQSLGYAVAYDDSGSTTVTPKALSAVINDDAKFVGLADGAGYAGATYSGFARGESAANLSASVTIARSNMGPAQGIGDAVGTYAGVLTGAINVTAGNYVLDPGSVTAGSYHIVTPDTLIVRVGSAGTVYGGSAAYDVTQVRYYDTVFNSEVALTQGTSEFNWNLGGNAAQAVNFTLASSGVNVGSHRITGSVLGSNGLPGTASSTTPSQLIAIGGRLAVTPRALTVSATKVYDGNDALPAVTLGNLRAGETLATSNARASDRNVATGNKYVSQLTLADGTGLAANYQLPSLAAYDAAANAVTLTPRPLDVAVTKVYDGLAGASAAQTVLGNMAAGESLAISGVALSNAHVATAGKYVSALTLGDNGPYLASNYALPALGAAGARNAATVTPQPLRVTVGGSTGSSKTYDGSTAAGSGFTPTLVADGFVAGDSAGVSAGSAAYDTRSVDAQRITLSGLALGSIASSAGSVASDYAIDASAAFTRGSITPRGVGVAGSPAPNKVYDGTTGIDGAVVALAAATSSSGKVTGDDLGIVAIGGSFNVGDAGTGRSYTLADVALAGADARNYVLTGGSQISGSDGVITPRPLSISATKVYDGTTALPGVTLGNLVAGEYLLTSAITANDAHVAGASFVRTLTLGNVLSGGTPVFKTANYSLPGTGGGGVTSGAVNTLVAAAGNSAAVTRAALTVTLAETQVSKVYDGSSGAASGYAPGWVVTGLVAGDSAAALAPAGSSFNAAGVAGASTFTLSGIALGGITGSNASVAGDYVLNTTTLTLPGSIGARPVAADVAAGVSKVYDATTGFGNLSVGLTTVAGNADSGVLVADAGNVVLAAGGGGFDSKGAGSGKSYTLTGLNLTGSAAANYRIASGDSLSGINGVITPKQLVVSGLSAVTKAYDGGTAAAAYGGAAGSLLTVAPGGNTAADGRLYSGDAVTLAGAPTGGTYDSKDVATATRVTFAGYGLAGADAANYTVVASAAASITPRALGATPTFGAKTYDATTAIAVSGTVLSGLVGSETLSISASGVLDSANAGSRTATVGYLLANGSNGGLAANYSLASTAHAVSVAPKALTMTGTTAAGKTYDGTTAATVAQGTLSGFVGSETVASSASGVFDSANAGNRNVAVGYVLANGSNGGLAANYSLGAQTIAATIARKGLLLSAAKTYDGSTGLNSVALGGLVGSETLGFSGAVASDAHAATAGKFVSAITLVDGTGLAANYQLPTLNAANAPVTISPKAASASAAIGGTLTRAYDGATGTTASVGGSVSGAIAGDVLTLDTSGVSLTYDSAHVLAASQIAASGSLALAVGGSNGSLASDYAFTAPLLSPVAATITPRVLTPTLANSGVTKVYDGSTAAPAGFVPALGVSGLVAGDSAASLAHTGAAFDDRHVVFATKVSVAGITLGGITGSRGSLASDYALAASSVDVAATITPKPITLSAGKVYDGDTALGNVSYFGLIGAESLAAAGVTAADAHVATAGNFINGITLQDHAGTLASDYLLPTLNAANASVTVTPALLSPAATIAGPLTRVYDGSTGTAASVAGTLSGTVPGDMLTLDTSGVTLAYDSAHAGGASQIAASGSAGFAIVSSSNGSQPSDYAYTPPVIAPVAAAIAPAVLTAALTNSGVGKVYDGSTAASLIPIWAIGGLRPGDTAASLTHGAMAYDSRDVLAATKVTVSGLGIAGIGGTLGSLASDYTLASSSADVAAAITPKGLTLAATKVYDGGTALGSNVVLNGLVGAETLTVTNAAASDAHVATAGNYIDHITLLDGSGLAANYRLPTLNAASAPVTINPKALTAGAAIAGAFAKIYDGTTATTAAVAGSVGGAAAGDVLTLDTSGVTLAYDSAHVVAASQIAASGSAGLLISGSGLASDYVFTAPAIAPVPAHIVPATFSAVLANGGVAKVYDGSTAAPAGFTPAWSISGLAAADSATAALGHTAAAYDSKDVTAATRVTVSGLALTGVDPADYVLAATSAHVPAAITPRTVSVTGLVVADKTYDATTAASVTDWGRVATGVAGETLGVVGSSAAFADANAGSGKTVTAGGYVLGNGSGNAANYRLAATTATAAADIARAPLTITAFDDAKFVSQPDPAGYTGLAIMGFAGSDNAVTLGGTITVTRSDAGVETAGIHRGVLTPDVSGLNWSNYRLVTHSGDFTIVPSNQLLVRAAVTASTYGSAAPYTVAGASYFDGSTVHPLVVAGTGGNGWTVSDGAGGSASFTLVARGAALSGAGFVGVGVHALDAGGLHTVNPQNFSDTVTVVGAHIVAPKTVTAGLAAAPAKVYDGSTAIGAVDVALAGIEAGDRVATGGVGAFASRNAGSGIAYAVSGLTLAGADAANYRLAGGAAFSGNDGVITPRPLTVNVSGVAKVYDGNTGAAFTSSDDRIAGDAVTVLGAAAFADKDVGSAKPVTVSGLALAGADAGNYALTRGTAQTAADITRLGSVAWIGGAGGSWFDPANWAGGAVPDRANVANVVIPAGATVTFDGAAAAPVALDSLGSAGSLRQNAGALNVGGGGVTLHGFAQNGGSFTSAGPVQLQRFEQTGGSTAARGGLVVDGGFSQGARGTVVVVGPARIDDSAGGMTVGNLQVDGPLLITSSDGDVLQVPGTVLAVSGRTQIDAGRSRIVLDGAGNDFGGRVDARGSDITLADGTGGLVLGDIAAGGDLRASSSDGSITQAAPASITVAGSSTLEARRDAVVLDGEGNDFGGAFNARGGAVTVRDAAGGLVLGAIDAGTLSASSGNGGDLTQAPGTALHIAGATALAAGRARIVLDAAGNAFGGRVDARGGDITLADGAGGLVLGTVVAGGNLRATSSGGSITQAANGAITVAGTTTVDAGRDAIVLDGAANDFTGAFNARGAAITVRDAAGGLVLGDIAAGGDFRAASGGGSVTQAAGGAVRVGGNTSIDARRDAIVLDGAANDFTGAFNARGAAITVHDAVDGLVLGDIAAGGDFRATSSGGRITQAAGSAITVAGTSTVDAGADGVVLDGAANDFTGPFNARGAAVTVRDGSGGLMLGRIDAETLSATSAGGHMLQAPGMAVTVRGAAVLAAPGGEIRIATAGNRFGTLTTPGSMFGAEQSGASHIPPEPLLPAPPLPAREDAPPPPELALATGVALLSVDVTGPAVAGGWPEEITVTVSKAARAGGFAFALPAALLAGLDAGMPIQAKRESGRALPEWLTFDGDNRRFTATAVPPRRLPLRLVVRVGDRSMTVVLRSGRGR